MNSKSALGSTSLTTDATGTLISELRYTAWGEVRYTFGATPTDYTYTGQYSYANDFGLLFYNARWYDPSLGRFAQADTVIPPTQGVQAWDRYAYANNNHLRYTDPTGHMVACDKNDWECQFHWDYPIKQDEKYTKRLTEKQAKIVDFLLDASEIVASVTMDPVDWALTADECARGRCNPWMLLFGLLPIIPSSLGRHADDTVDLYRAVSKGEMDDMLTNRYFRPKPDGRSMDIKWFWETPEGGKRWMQDRGLDNVVKVTVPRSVLDLASERWSNLDQLGPAVGFIDEGLDAFNEAIISITTIWSR